MVGRTVVACRSPEGLRVAVMLTDMEITSSAPSLRRCWRCWRCCHGSDFHRRAQGLPEIANLVLAAVGRALNPDSGWKVWTRSLRDVWTLASPQTRSFEDGEFPSAGPFFPLSRWKENYAKHIAVQPLSSLVSRLPSAMRHNPLHARVILSELMIQSRNVCTLL